MMPSIDRVLQQSQNLIETWGHDTVSNLVRKHIAQLRSDTEVDDAEHACAISTIREAIHDQLVEQDRRGIAPVINLSGIVLHTNLGRACLPEQAAEAARLAALNPTNLEYDLRSGKRGNRDHHVEHLICELTGCEAATVVNNNAAAVVLVLSALAKGREVPVSRGELVEIGGSFRMPEIMEVAGCNLVEVGSTNRTHLKDYQRAISGDTALLMKVHTSNYRIDGFEQSVEAKALAQLALENDLPFVFDLGSGCLADFSALGLPAEPLASDYISQGVDLITFSGDKLLGGPQCGIVAGKKSLVQKIRNHPLKRALRPDAMTYAALAEVLKLYRHPDTLTETLPSLRHMTRPVADIKAQADRLCPKISESLPEHLQVSKEPCLSQVGSGALPVESLDSFAVSITSASNQDGDLRRLSAELRKLPKPVISRLRDGELLLDLRCLDCEAEFLQQLPELRDALTC